MKGPYPIFCRGHSGSRLLSEAFRQNNIWMGHAENQQRDAEGFEQKNPVVRFLIQEGFRYASMPQTERHKLQKLMMSLVEPLKASCPDPEEAIAYGWKRAITTFACEIALDAYPEAKAVHLIRDGRDVMLSRLESRMRQLDDPINRLVVLGDPSISEYRGKPLDNAVIAEYRNEIEMHHWVTAVRFGMRGRRYGDRYLEIRYEDLCERPDATLGRIFDFLKVPFLEKAREWIRANASVGSIGKWKNRAGELMDAIRIGEPLLAELGYLDDRYSR